MHIWGKISHFAEKLTWKWLRYLCRFWVVKIYFELTFRKIESKMKLLRGQEFFITSFIITASAVVSVSLTEYGLIDGRVMLVTDVEDCFCWWQVWDVDESPIMTVFYIGKVINITRVTKILNLAPSVRCPSAPTYTKTGRTRTTKNCTRKGLPGRPICLCIVKQAQ